MHPPPSVPLAIRAWLLFSLPLIVWDAGYVLLRPHTLGPVPAAPGRPGSALPAGRLHAPLWTAYTVYARVDRLYSGESWARGDGLTGAQAVMNLLEAGGYVRYWWATAAGEEQAATTGLLWGFAAAVMTVAKTLLYEREQA
ncbi:MAG: hypothetical protein M1826_006151 [Phylliscum demangeonii]|nr:MAG: hypothetical protein M1826_006151 [Phylliscum demangeonii]